MPQMHPLLWAIIFSFSLICLLVTITLVYFSTPKLNMSETSEEKPQTKNFNWKW